MADSKVWKANPPYGEVAMSLDAPFQFYISPRPGDPQGSDRVDVWRVTTPKAGGKAIVEYAGVGVYSTDRPHNPNT